MRKGFLFVVITIVTMMLTTTGCADKKASGADSTMTDSTDTTAADTLEQLITLGLTIGSSLWAWWKNNSFTCEACEADEYLCQHRKERPRKP